MFIGTMNCWKVSKLHLAGGGWGLHTVQPLEWQ